MDNETSDDHEDDEITAGKRHESGGERLVSGQENKADERKFVPI